MRVPLVRDGENPAFDRAMAAATFASGGIPDISRVLGHQQDVVSRMQAYNDALRQHGLLSHVETELVILMTSRRAGNRYAFARHISIARAAGISDPQLSAMARLDADPALFAGRELCLVRMAAEVTGTLDLSDLGYAEFLQHFEPTALPLVLQVIGFYVLMAVVQRGVDIEVEPAFAAELEDFWPAGPDGPTRR